MILKCYIDVNFTIEEDFTRFTEEEQQEFMSHKELMTAIFKNDLLERLQHFSENIKDLDVVINFEGE
mgnify:CR=1 FL=1